jgi:hypothetical protein
LENNSKTATPVNVAGFAPGAGVDATIVAPLPLPVAVVGPDPLPVILPTPTYSVKQQFLTGASLQGVVVLSAVPCELDIIAGYNSEPTAATLMWILLFNSATLIIAGAVPQIAIPVYGGKTPFSYGVPIEFVTGLCLAFSTTEGLYTEPASQYLAFSAIWRTAA